MPERSTRIGKGLADIAVEGDVAETQGGHDRQRPVEAGDNRVFAALKVHDHMEKETVDRDKQAEKQDELHQGTDIAARPSVLQEEHDLGGEVFHGRVRFRVWMDGNIESFSRQVAREKRGPQRHSVAGGFFTAIFLSPEHTAGVLLMSAVGA